MSVTARRGGGWEVGGNMAPLPRRGSPETGRGSPSPLTSAAPTRTGAERLVSSRPITEFVRRRAPERLPETLRSSPMELFEPTASDKGATSVKVRRSGSDMKGKRRFTPSLVAKSCFALSNPVLVTAPVRAGGNN